MTQRLAPLLVLSLTAAFHGLVLAGPAAVPQDAVDKTGLPKPIAAMMQRGKGVKFQDKFDAPGGLTGYVLSAANGERRIFYVTPDRKQAILGIMFDSDLKNVTAEHQKTYMNVLEFLGSGEKDPSKIEGEALDLARRNGYSYVEGSGSEINVVFDSECVPCGDFYRRTRPYVDKVTIRWIPVASVNERSARWLQAFVQADNKGEVLKQMFSQPATQPPSVGVSVEANQVHRDAMAILRAAGTKTLPVVLYVDEKNATKISSGGIDEKQLKAVAAINENNRKSIAKRGG